VRGTLYLGAEKEAQMLNAAMRCREVIEALKPLTFERRDVDSLKRLVEGARLTSGSQAALRFSQ
jgi:hypothetical protein